MECVKKSDIVEANPWYKNGDHPLDYQETIVDVLCDNKEYSSEYQKENDWEGQLVRRFRHPDVKGNSVCPECNKIMNKHGWIDQGANGVIVCPGDIVIKDSNGDYSSLPYKYFKKHYRILRKTL